MQHIRGVNGPILGHYRIAGLSGQTTGLGANAPIFSARWATNAFVRAAILRLRVQTIVLTPFTAAQELLTIAQLASAFTASDSTGTNLLPVAGQNSLAQVSEAAQGSQFSDIRICAAAALTPGARTLDTVAFAMALNAQVQAAASAADIINVLEFNVDSDQKTPLILQGGTPSIGSQVIPGVQPPGAPANQPNNAQGIIVSSSIAQGAAGVVRFAVEMEWVEYATNSAEVIN